MGNQPSHVGNNLMPHILVIKYKHQCDWCLHWSSRSLRTLPCCTVGCFISWSVWLYVSPAKLVLRFSPACGSITKLPNIFKCPGIPGKEIVSRVKCYILILRKNWKPLLVFPACSLCFAEKTIYTQEVLAVVMQQLMEMNPLPTLLMRTVIQSLATYPKLSGFVMNIMQRLITKQVRKSSGKPWNRWKWIMFCTVPLIIWFARVRGGIQQSVWCIVCTNQEVVWTNLNVGQDVWSKWLFAKIRLDRNLKICCVSNYFRWLNNK